MEPSPESLVFDLDGTLWDTTGACAVAWNNVLSRLGIPYRKIVEEDVRAVTGKPHEDCIRTTFQDLNEEQIFQISEQTQTEDNLVIAATGGTLYPGVLEGLHTLVSRYRLFVVSNCQSGYIETFIRFANLEGVFQDFECWGGTKKSKSENLAMLLERNQAKAAAMVGDTEGDGVAARACHVPFAYVSYGFGTLTREPDWTFDNFTDLAGFFMNRRC